MGKPRHPRLSAQNRACERVLAEVLGETLVNRRPADRALAYCLKRNRQYGSRDRRFFSEAVFAVFRWWGWLRQLPDSSALRVGDNPGGDGQDSLRLEPRQSAVLLFAAILVDHPEGALDNLSVWAETLRIPESAWRPWSHLEQPEARFRSLARHLDCESGDFDWRDLLPNWAWRELAEPAPPSALEKLALWLQKRPPIWLRAQGAISAEGLAKILRRHEITAVPHPKLARVLKVEPSPVNLYTTEPFRRGMFEIQDLASQIIGLACRPQAGQRWWDACAGAGGKSLQLADLMQGRGTVVATDIRPRKLEDLRKRARRAGFSNLSTRLWEGKGASGKPASFDGVLVDAPCTCSGTWRRNPDARWTTARNDLEELSQLQLKLLRAAAEGVKRGGLLVYATCSIFERENRLVVERFLEQAPEFSLRPLAHPATGMLADGCLQVWPWEEDCDAMFVARMIRSQ